MTAQREKALTRLRKGPVKWDDSAPVADGILELLKEGLVQCDNDRELYVLITEDDQKVAP